MVTGWPPRLRRCLGRWRTARWAPTRCRPWLQQRAVAQGEILTEQLKTALQSRVTIEQAKGALARIRGVSVDEAFTLMRDHARRNHLRLTDLARGIVTDPTSHAELTRDPGSPT